MERNTKNDIISTFKKIRGDMSKKEFKNKKYTFKRLENKINAYFDECDVTFIEFERQGKIIRERQPYTMEHLTLYLKIPFHKFSMYGNDDEFKIFHPLMEKARLRIIGDWISKGLVGQYNGTFLKYLMPHLSMYKITELEEENIETMGLKTITLHHGDEKQIEYKKEEYIDTEIQEKE